MTDTDRQIRETILNTTRNVLILGPGGTGKSTLVVGVIAEARALGMRCALTASTGVAAVNIGGSTLHSFFGVGLCKGEIDAIISRVRSNKKALKSIVETDLLVIDEISMISDEFFAKLDYIARYFRQNTKPFGDMRIIATGDFLQLPPVEGDWVFESVVWDNLEFCHFEMTEPRRFTDRSFHRTLRRVRVGKPTTADLAKLAGRVDAYKRYKRQERRDKRDGVDTSLKVKPTLLYSLKVNVEQMNKRELAKLTTREVTMQAFDDFTALKPRVSKALYERQLDLMAPQTLAVKVGAQVMLTVNLSVEEGLCNGTRGVITDISDSADMITVKVLNGESITVGRHMFQTKDKSGVATRSQFPLIIAYALTIHKCQGTTLDFCVIDLGPNIFANGQGYVALSRARDWNSVLLSAFTNKAIKADERALEYMDSFGVDD